MEAADALYFLRENNGRISSAVLARLRKIEDQEVRRVVTLMDQYGAGLEQEVLLLG
jgi:hypothetical protein